MTKRVVLVVASALAALAGAAAVRRRQMATEAEELWREATSDASR